MGKQVKIASSDESGLQVLKALGLDNHGITKLEIVFEAGKQIVVNVTIGIDMENDPSEAFVAILEKYELIRKP